MTTGSYARLQHTAPDATLALSSAKKANTVKVVTYNFRFGGGSKDPNLLKALLNDLAPDLIFAQEAFHPSEYLSQQDLSEFAGVVHRAVPARNWGSMIMSRHWPLQEIVLPEFEGWVVGARLHTAAIGRESAPLTIYSIHAPSPGPYQPIVDRILDRIQAMWDGTPLMIAGDFNLTTAVRHSSEALTNSRGELEMQARLRKDFDLFNAWQIVHPNESLPQTLRWSKDKAPPYHCDAIFVSGRHLKFLEQAVIHASSEWSERSDHNPVSILMRQNAVA